MYTPARFPGFNIALNVVITIAVIVGFLVIFQSMYTAVMERTREIGILKSMGASKLTVVGVVLRECAVLAIAGVLVGIAATFGVRALLGVRFPALSFRNHRGVDCQRHPYRLWRGSVRRALPGLDGGPQGPHRRACLRINDFDRSLAGVAIGPEPSHARGKIRSTSSAIL